jgi:hypothetical protein
MNAYEAKQEAKRQRLEAAADRARAKATADYKRADLREEVSGIPLGQPILVGHHSEGRHRAAIRRADNAMRASIEADKRASELAARAAAVGTGGISSDDPEAIQKLQAEIDKAQEYQAAMKAANAKWRKEGNKAGRQADASWVDPPCAPYQLTNNGANIKRMEKRIAQLRAAHAAAEAAGGESKKTSYQGLCDLVENFEENRIQIIFEGKPDAAIRAELKSNGFRWAPSQSAWQRQLNNAGRYAATRFLRSQGVEA